MNPFKYIEWPAFLIALALGIFAVYVMDDGRRKIFIYPTPEIVGEVQYQDRAGTCFAYEQKEVKCPATGLYRLPAQ